MALTNEDLLAISQLLDTKLKAGLKPIQNDIETIKNEQAQMKHEQTWMKNEMSQMKNEMSQMKNEMSQMKNEQAQMKHEQTWMKNEMSQMKHELSGINLMIENEIRSDIKLLAENYVPAAKRYEEATAAIEAMQVDNEVMKNVIREHSEKLNEISRPA